MKLLGSVVAIVASIFVGANANNITANDIAEIKADTPLDLSLSTQQIGDNMVAWHGSHSSHRSHSSHYSSRW
ncbi:hypothetical protein CCY99_04820 [Helicobacter sp. 16-1353]|uniref:hypothetical protein n=1 Tax=Helicobacter sp. 16-1353 TaxID=2004996 RepID=UPI000DCE1C98|nr:hypothetical protein [Helicobacter sp. 16-1353]RAX54009.1 hypothetical protein CCY99_04820 [Helicobacter sp. 16-1353]